MADYGLSALDVVKQTDRSNCGKCGLKNCMAFAALVVQGQKDPRACPCLDEDFIAKIEEQAGKRQAEREDQRRELIEPLKQEMQKLDLEEAAERAGGWFEDGRVKLHVFGRIFELDHEGGLHSQCHVNEWVHLPLLLYVIYGQGKELSGKWLPFRELKGSQSWKQFFEYRGERVFQQMARQTPELFLDILDLFGTEMHEDGPPADHRYLLYPFPKVPLLFCYTAAEGKFESYVNLFFDKSIEENLRVDATYYLAQGIIQMFQRIIERHGTVSRISA
ncbi:MAG: DUF3786 domain-containing protein [bacterium]